MEGFDAPIWQGSMGGEKWMASAETTLRLYNAIEEGEELELFNSWNAAVNCLHNCGKLMDKWIPNLAILDLKQGEHLIAPELYEVLYGKKAKGEEDEQPDYISF